MNDRTMIVLDKGASRFQCRAAALIWQGVHILIHRSTADPFWALPGGRVELGEASAEALAREMEEELGSTASIGTLRLLIENFFSFNGRQVHELCFYYEVVLNSPPPFIPESVVHRSRDGEADLEFRWVLPEDLSQFDLKPSALIPLLANVPAPFVHRVHRDSQ